MARSGSPGTNRRGRHKGFFRNGSRGVAALVCLVYSVYLVYLVYSVCSVYSVWLAYLVCSVYARFPGDWASGGCLPPFWVGLSSASAERASPRSESRKIEAPAPSRSEKRHRPVIAYPRESDSVILSDRGRSHRAGVGFASMPWTEDGLPMLPWSPWCGGYRPRRPFSSLMRSRLSSLFLMAARLS